MLASQINKIFLPYSYLKPLRPTYSLNRSSAYVSTVRNDTNLLTCSSSPCEADCSQSFSPYLFFYAMGQIATKMAIHIFCLTVLWVRSLCKSQLGPLLSVFLGGSQSVSWVCDLSKARGFLPSYQLLAELSSLQVRVWEDERMAFFFALTNHFECCAQSEGSSLSHPTFLTMWSPLQYGSLLIQGQHSVCTASNLLTSLKGLS